MEARRVLLVGSGGREHALAMALTRQEGVQLHTAPGNPGTARLGTNHPVGSGDVTGLIALADELDVHLVVVGPEAPLCDGLADALGERLCFGPVAAHAALEGSKSFAKEAMEAAGVPTAEHVIVRREGALSEALDRFSDAPWVIKQDGLAGGKGVLVSDDREQAEAFALSAIATSGSVVIEAFLPGEEASMLVLMDASGYRCLPASQDHKRAGEGDAGPNTGGMGAYCPAPIVTPDVQAKVESRIVAPMHAHLSAQDVPYRGVLYVGLMIDEHDDPYVVEFNVRFGDPECQVTMPLLGDHALEWFTAVAKDEVAEMNRPLETGALLTVVLASEGYPSSAVTGREIAGLDLNARAVTGQDRAWVNLAGVKEDHDGTPVSTGGRVLSVTGMSDSLQAAADLAYARLASIDLDGAHHRRDIGAKAGVQHSEMN
ncbi:MAG TPA: phosphoribosylamine--glycine ligase [Candidatus Poseidoniaceae archaeon]|nr:MAG TPA: phosphoribosylamine--glycine ligase [Candidatus Poseidoniales archaeon]HIH53579.1 phosphoribosylamine--glycine ligase [Candidatus Poseidoniaceae archaeon]